MITRKWGKYPQKIFYIGMTYRRDFSKRLSEHMYWLSQVISNVKVRLGYPVEKSHSYKRLRDAESLLIYVYEPLEVSKYEK